MAEKHNCYSTVFKSSDSSVHKTDLVFMYTAIQIMYKYLWYFVAKLWVLSFNFNSIPNICVLQAKKSEKQQKEKEDHHKNKEENKKEKEKPGHKKRDKGNDEKKEHDKHDLHEEESPKENKDRVDSDSQGSSIEIIDEDEIKDTEKEKEL